MTKHLYSKSEIETETTFSLILDGLKISKDRGRNIISYAKTLIRDYENRPADALKEIRAIDSIMSDHQLFIDTYNNLTRVIYPGIDRNKVKSIKEEMDKIEANLNRV